MPPHPKRVRLRKWSGELSVPRPRRGSPTREGLSGLQVLHRRSVVVIDSCQCGWRNHRSTLFHRRRQSKPVAPMTEPTGEVRQYRPAPSVCKAPVGSVVEAPRIELGSCRPSSHSCLRANSSAADDRPILSAEMAVKQIVVGGMGGDRTHDTLARGGFAVLRLTTQSTIPNLVR